MRNKALTQGQKRRPAMEAFAILFEEFYALSLA
jgi:hypothetical protein